MKLFKIHIKCILEGVQKCFSDSYEVVSTISGADLANMKYTRPLYSQDTCPLLPGVHVTNSAGTGLVHTAPAHGQDDFRIGQW